MNLKQLEAFVKVVETGSFSKAAKELYLTQPTVSAHISTLERELKVRLFIRNTKEVMMSEAGQELYRYAKQMVELECQIAEHFNMRGKNSSSHCVTIAASTIPAQYLLPEVLMQFKKRYPDEQFKLIETDSTEVVSQIVNSMADVGFTGTVLEKKYCRYIPFYKDKLAIITPNTEKYRTLLESSKDDISWIKKEHLADFAHGAEKPVSKPPEFETCAGRFDEHQAEIVRSNPDDRVYVNAGPGSGKTHTLIERIKYLLEDQMVEPGFITVLSFTRAAVAVVQSRLKVAAENGEIHGMWQDVDVTTFDKLCTRLLYFVAQKTGDKDAEKNISKLNYEQRIVAATKLIECDSSLLEGCEHLIVDETQDLVGVRADLVMAMLANIPSDCGFTLFGDRCQSVYEYQVKDGGTTPSEFCRTVFAKYEPREMIW